MTENGQPSKREQHMDFGGNIVYRKYRIWEENTERKDTSYIYEDDFDIKERMEAIEWEEQYKKKCQKMLDENNK